MIKELVNFTKNLDEDFKNSVYKPSKGIHIIIGIRDNETVKIDEFQYYDGKSDLNDFLHKVLFYERYSSYIDMNKQQKFDPKQKIHSASPFSIAFNFSLGNNKKEIENQFKNKLIDQKDKTEFDSLLKEFKLQEVSKSVETYFKNAQKLCFEDLPIPETHKKIKSFQKYISELFFSELKAIKIEGVNILKSLKEKEYVRVYLGDIDDNIWKTSYSYYFNSVYPLNQLLESDFINTYSDKKTFLTHQTATFEVGSKISGYEAKVLNEFKELLSVKEPRIIPNPLPIFIFKEELQNQVIGIFKENEFKLSSRELIEKMVKYFKDDFGNYYLLNWSLGKGIRINDLDFVSKFEYLFDAKIENHFDLKNKDTKENIVYPPITNVFELEKKVFYSLIQNKFNSVDYFTNLEDIKSGAYENLANTYLSFTKYRKPIYDFVYKSTRQGIDEHVFYDLVFNHIKDDIKHNRSFGIKDKLNIWFSLYENFNQSNNTNNITMASKLKNYQEFVSQLAMGKANTDETNDKEFAFAAGQIIEYVLKKSASENRSYQLLEPYLQKAKCTELKRAIATDIARFKHAIDITETRFKSVCDFVLTYETEVNVKELLPELLAGIFSKNQFFHKNDNN